MIVIQVWDHGISLSHSYSHTLRSGSVEPSAILLMTRPRYYRISLSHKDALIIIMVVIKNELNQASSLCNKNNQNEKKRKRHSTTFIQQDNTNNLLD